MNCKEKIKSRREYNIKCLELLIDVCKHHKDLRLGQLLDCMDTCMHDEFYEEPVDMYERYKSSLKRMNLM